MYSRYTSSINSISYNHNDISYKTTDKSSDVLKINFLPRTVTINGKSLTEKDIDKSTCWNYDPKTNILRVCHDSGLVVIKDH
jgi:hypothetical protein